MKKYFKKALCAVLSLCVILSVCFVGGITAAAGTENVYNFYVEAGGSGDGSSIETPAPSVQAAIATINDCGLAEGEVANINIVQNISKITATAKNAHNIAVWGDCSKGTVEHAATIVIKAYSNNVYSGTVNSTYLLTNTNLGSDWGIVLGGPTIFEDVTVLFPRSSNLKNLVPIGLNGNSATIGKDIKFAYLDQDSSGNQINGSSYSGWTTGIPEDLTTIMAESTMLPIYISENTSSTPNQFNKPVNFVVNQGR